MLNPNRSSHSKQDGRDYMERRQAERKPPPSEQEIKRQMGWALIDAEREQALRVDTIERSRP